MFLMKYAIPHISITDNEKEKMIEIFAKVIRLQVLRKHSMSDLINMFGTLSF